MVDLSVEEKELSLIIAGVAKLPWEQVNSLIIKLDNARKKNKENKLENKDGKSIRSKQSKS